VFTISQKPAVEKDPFPNSLLPDVLTVLNFVDLANNRLKFKIDHDMIKMINKDLSSSY